jgi:hypothetical protein
MVSAKAARMKVVAVPEPARLSDPKFGLADLVIPSLEDFTEERWQVITETS